MTNPLKCFLHYHRFRFSDSSFCFLTASTFVSLYMCVSRPPVFFAVHSFASLYDKPDFRACSLTASMSVPATVYCCSFFFIYSFNLHHLLLVILVYLKKFN